MEPAFVILKNCWCVHLHFVIYLLLLWYFSVCYRCCCLANNDVSATDWHNSWIVFMVQCTVFHIFLKEKGFSNVRKKGREKRERKKRERRGVSDTSGQCQGRDSHECIVNTWGELAWGVCCLGPRACSLCPAAGSRGYQALESAISGRAGSSSEGGVEREREVESER